VLRIIAWVSYLDQSLCCGISFVVPFQAPFCSLALNKTPSVRQRLSANQLLKAHSPPSVPFFLIFATRQLYLVPQRTAPIGCFWSTRQNTGFLPMLHPPPLSALNRMTWASLVFTLPSRSSPIDFPCKLSIFLFPLVLLSLSHFPNIYLFIALPFSQSIDRFGTASLQPLFLLGRTQMWGYFSPVFFDFGSRGLFPSLCLPR